MKSIPQFLENTRQIIIQYESKKSWVIRFPLLIIMMWIGFHHTVDPTYESILYWINLGFHEFGHLLFNLTRNEFLSFAGGTITQLALPIGACFMFWRQRDIFSIGFSITWIATNLFNIARYIGTTGDDVHYLFMLPGQTEALHDWVYLLGKLNMLESYAWLSPLLFFIAVIVLLLGLGFMGWVLWIVYHCQKNTD